MAHVHSTIEGVVNVLRDLHIESISDYSANNLEELFQQKCNKSPIAFEKLKNEIPEMAFYDNQRETFELKYYAINLYLIKKLNKKLNESDIPLLSIAQKTIVKNCIACLLEFGICKNLQPTMPFSVIFKTKQFPEDFLYNYNILKLATISFRHFTKLSNLKAIIFPCFLPHVLISLYQISYCPLKQSNDSMNTKLIQEQCDFQKILNELTEELDPLMHIKSTMLLFKLNLPNWLKRAFTKKLNNIIYSEKGVQNVATVLFDGISNDVTESWRVIEVLNKLVLQKTDSYDFKSNICVQVMNLLNSDGVNRGIERFVAQFAKEISKRDVETFKEIILPALCQAWVYFKDADEEIEDEQDVTKRLQQSSRILHLVFVDESNNSCLSDHVRQDFEIIVKLIFEIFCMLNESVEQIRNDLEEFLKKFFNTADIRFLETYFENIFYDKEVKSFLSLHSEIYFMIVDKQVFVRLQENENRKIIPDLLINLLTDEQKVILCGVLLKNVRFKLEPTKECEMVLKQTTINNNILLQVLVMPNVLTTIQEKPELILPFLKKTIHEGVVLGIHKERPCPENDHYNSIFLIIEILANKVSSENCKKFRIFQSDFELISVEGKSIELRDRCKNILYIINNEPRLKKHKANENYQVKEKLSNVEQALKDSASVFLPVRGHGLLSLAKLLEEKNSEALKKKFYLLNLFQLQLEDEDSYIYLNAIRGLVALGVLYPKKVIEILCEEYSNYDVKEGVDPCLTRLKIGEALGTVTRQLGIEANEHKSVLLNTFLQVTKDEDNFLRASSLSNLGEICRTLGPKIGSIMKDIVKCIFEVITTDPAPEPRRAACGVIKNIFIGLKLEAGSFLKEDYLSLAHLLKELHASDGDEIVKLQAQLALEELEICYGKGNCLK